MSTLEEKILARMDSIRAGAEAQYRLNKVDAYRRVTRANKVEAARDSLHVALVTCKERAENSLAQRLASADAILALSVKEKKKLQDAAKVLNPEAKAKAKAKSKAKAKAKSKAKAKAKAKAPAKTKTKAKTKAKTKNGTKQHATPAPLPKVVTTTSATPAS